MRESSGEPGPQRILTELWAQKKNFTALPGHLAERAKQLIHHLHLRKEQELPEVVVEGEEIISEVQSEEIHESENKQETVWTMRRKEFGLPEEADPNQLAKQKDEARSQAVAAYLQERPELELPRTLRAHEEIMRDGEQKIRAIIEQLPLKDRLRVQWMRTRALATLITHGVSHPQELLRTMEVESTRSTLSILYSVEPESLATSDYDMRQALFGFDTLYKQLTSDQFIERCKQIGNVPLAYERMHRIGAELRIISLRESGDDPVMSIVQKIARVSDKQFHEGLTGLLPYRFLFPQPNYEIDEIVHFGGIIDFISNHAAISPAEREALDMAQQTYTPRQ